MKRALASTFLCLLATAAIAQETPAPAPAPTTPPESAEPQVAAEGAAPDVEGPARAPQSVRPLFANTIDAALQTYEVDTNSSKFEEYRAIPEGIAGPAFRLFNQNGFARILVTADRLGQDDRRFDISVEHRAVGIEAFFDEIPHRIGNEARSVLVRAANDAWGVSDTTQQALQSAIEARFAQSRTTVNFAFLSGLVQPLIAAPFIYDLGFDRRRGGLSLQLFPERALDTRVSYFREKRVGTRPAGTSFGFGNVVETGEPIDYVTEEAGVRLEMPLAKGLVRGGVIINQFSNDLRSYRFDNPFRAVDTTDANAYLGPGSQSVNGPSFGRMSLAPNSDQLIATVGGVYKLPARSRLSADVTWSHLTTDDRLIPFTSNSAITIGGRPATDPQTLPDQVFDGEINVLSASLAFNSRPIAGLGLNARLRHYDLSNESERIRFEQGYVRFDSSAQPIPRISVPYGWTNTRLDLYGTYDLRLVTLEGGFRHNLMERDFRETEETTENLFHVAADVRPFNWAAWRTSFEFGSRDFDEYDSERSEHASFLDPGPPANLLELRRYDQAKRDTSRIVSMLQLTPFEAVAFSANYIRYFDDYSDDSTHGLLTWRNNSMTFEADYTPSPRWSLFAFFTHDEWSTFQRGRQSGGTLNPDPLDDWTSLHIDKANTYGVGGNFTFIPDRLVLRVNGSLQKVSGYNNLESPPGGAIVGVAMDIPRIDDTSFLSTSAELRYTVRPAWHFGFGLWSEDYEIFDLLSTGTQPYMPAAFFLVPNDANYQGTVFYVRTGYNF